LNKYCQELLQQGLLLHQLLPSTGSISLVIFRSLQKDFFLLVHGWLLRPKATKSTRRKILSKKWKTLDRQTELLVQVCCSEPETNLAVTTSTKLGGNTPATRQRSRTPNSAAPQLSLRTRPNQSSSVLKHPHSTDVTR